MHEKRGISTVVTTLVIILLSLVAVGIVWVVVSNLLNKGSEGVSLDKLSYNLDIESAYVDGTDVKVTVKRSAGGGELTGVSFIFHNGTDSLVVTRKVTINELETVTFTFNSSELSGINNINLVSISPIYILSGREESGNILDTSNIGTVSSPGGGTGGVCGDSSIGAGEQCDDGGTVSGDGCSATCQNEVPVSCDNDNIVDPGEFCDGTNLNSESCTTLGYTGGSLSCNNCAFDTSSCTSPNLPICGNSIIESGEQCDDGGTVSGDGCSSTCQTETQGAVCGNLICEVGETTSSCPGDCPAPASCNGVWDQQDVADGNQCDGTPLPLNCLATCSCQPGYIGDGNGACVIEPPLNSGIIDSVWPLGAVKHFDSDNLPKSSVTVLNYIGKYVNFSGSGADPRCLRISYAEYLNNQAYDKSYIRLELIANLSSGNAYQIWSSSTCGA